MASLQQQMSSGSEEGGQYVLIEDERKKRRILSNRESARRSRAKKLKQLDDLLSQAAQLQKENNEIMHNVNSIAELYVQVELENNVVRAQMKELSDRLQSLNSVLHIAEEVAGFSMDIPEMPDSLLKPWQVPCPTLAIMASSNMLGLGRR